MKSVLEAVNPMLAEARMQSPAMNTGYQDVANAMTRNVMAGLTKAHAHRLSGDTPDGTALWQSPKVGADQRCVDLPGPQKAAVWTDDVERAACRRPHTPAHTACRPAMLQREREREITTSIQPAMAYEHGSVLVSRPLHRWPV